MRTQKSEGRKLPNLTEGPIFLTIIKFSLPLAVSYLFQQLYNAADTVIVGHFLGEKSLAAVGACTAVYELLIGFGTGFGNGLGIVISRAYGSLQTSRLKRAVASSILITLLVTFFITLFGTLFLKRLLIILGTPSEILEGALSYITVIALFSGAIFAYNLFSGFLRAIGNSFVPLLFLIFSSVMNIILDVVFIKFLSMGVRGTAIATVIAQGASAVLCFFYILRKTPILIPQRESWKGDKNLYRDLFGQGLSMALMSALVSSGSVILQSSINGFGTMVIAGHISARKIFAITIIPLITLGLSSATFVSQNLGAGKKDRIVKGIRISNLMCIIWGLACTVVIPFIAKFLIGTISGSTNFEVLDYGSKYITFMQPFYAVLGVLFVSRNSLQGLGSKVLPLISSIIELVGKILFTLVIIPHAGLWGIILCEPLIWVAMTIQLLWVYLRHPAVKEGRALIASEKSKSFPEEAQKE